MAWWKSDNDQSYRPEKAGPASPTVFQMEAFGNADLSGHGADQ
jgi:hypothetical protein